MKKKKVLLLSSIASVALLSATAAVVFSGQANAARLSADDIPPYQIEFTKSDCNFTTKEEDDDRYYLDFYQETGIGGLYEIGSTVDGSYAYAESIANIDLDDPDCILEISGSSYQGIQISFGLIPRATLDTTSSYMNIEVDGEPQYVTNVAEAGEYEGRKHYEWSYDGDETVRLISFVLVFSC